MREHVIMGTECESVSRVKTEFYEANRLDSDRLLRDTRGVKEIPTVGSEVIIRIGHNRLPARVLAIRDTGSYQVRLEHSGSIL